jgi:hypothetical protein
LVYWGCGIVKALVKHKRRVNRVFSKLGVEAALRSRPPALKRKFRLLPWLPAQPLHPRLRGTKLRRKGKELAKLVIFLPLLFVLKGLSPWSLVRGNTRLLTVFPMPRFRQLRVLLSWDRRKLRRLLKRIDIATVQRVPSTFSDDEMIDEPRPKGFSS